MTKMNLGKGVLPELPFDIVLDIIIRLPVKSLCRFKCVAKPWLSLISNPGFAKKHFDLNKRNQSKKTECLIYISESTCHSVALDRPEPTTVHLGFEEEGHQMRFDLIACSCNGLLMLFDIQNSIILANPSTKECRKLPQCPFLMDSESALLAYGFGYDSSRDDYRVVNIISDVKRNEPKAVSVYSLRANSWTSIESSVTRLLDFIDTIGFFLNGAFHWHGAKGVIVFDLASESFNTMLLPRDGRIDVLEVIGDRLCGFELIFHRSGRVNIWLMNEYGVRDSWVKYSIISSPYSIGWMLTSKSGNLLMRSGLKIVSFDLQDGTYRDLITQEIPAICHVTYEESLIRLQEQ